MQGITHKDITGDLERVTEIQQEFQESDEFVYFRKGEFENGVAVVGDYLEMIASRHVVSRAN